MKLVEIVQKLNDKEWLCICFCNSKEDATLEPEGLVEGVSLAEGSMCYTSSLDIAVLNTSDEWVWKNE